MNALYYMELPSILTELDAYIDQLFDDAGFYESIVFTKHQFKQQLILDYQTQLEEQTQ